MTASPRPSPPPRRGRARVRGMPPAMGRSAERWRGQHPPWAVTVAAGLLILLGVGLALVNQWRPLDTYQLDHTAILQPPSWSHPMGTDNLGRDVLTWSLHGLRTSLVLSAVAAIAATALGGLVGLAAGSLGGRVDAVVMRVVDIYASQSHFLFGLLLLVLLRPVAGPGPAIVAAVGLTHWITTARIVRAEVLALRDQVFVRAAVNAGATRRQLIGLHHLPHVTPVMLLAFVLAIPHAVFHETGYSFLGLGMPLERPSLGRVLGLGQANVLAGGWWVAVLPGLLLFVVAVCIGTLGERGRDRLDPQLGSELRL